MNSSDIVWNQQARDKILADADGLLADAVLKLARAMPDADSDTVFAALNAELKDHFIDYSPGPDIRKYADAIAGNEIDLD